MYSYSLAIITHKKRIHVLSYKLLAVVKFCDQATCYLPQSYDQPSLALVCVCVCVCVCAAAQTVSQLKGHKESRFVTPTEFSR